MKLIQLSVSLLLMVSLLACERDNYEPPSSTLTGRVEYNNQAIGLRSGGVQLELWQPSYPLSTKIPVHIDQDGSFSASLFDGDYKLSFLEGNGPWVVSHDTIEVSVKGKTSVNVPVRPYFNVKEEIISNEAGKLSSIFNLEQVDNSRSLQFVGLYIGTTAVLDNINNEQKIELQAIEIPSIDSPISLEASLSAVLAEREYVFARVGIKTAGVNEMIFSPVVKIIL